VGLSSSKKNHHVLNGGNEFQGMYHDILYIGSNYSNSGVVQSELGTSALKLLREIVKMIAGSQKAVPFVVMCLKKLFATSA